MAGRARALGSRLRPALGRLSLRARLLLGVLLVALVGLVVADIVVYSEVDNYLVSQLDNQISSSAPLNYARDLRSGFDTSGLPLHTWVYLVGPTAQTAEGAVVPTPTSALPPQPKLPSDLYQEVGPAGLFLTVGSSGGSPLQYRVYAQSAPFNSGLVIAIATPLSGVAATMHRLVLIDAAVSLVVVILLVVLGLVVVRLGLRPLAEIEATAEKIAAGDLSERVRIDAPATEVGRLGRSLNAMLSQIEHAFFEQQASENRLRQFLADASHELRTPVTSIRGYSELFRRGASANPEDLALAMRRIEDESVRMGVLVDDLLLLARLDQGRPLARDDVDLAAIAKDAAADAQVVAPERNISVDAPDPVQIKGDEQRLHQVVANLLENALRYTGPEAAIEVAVHAVDGVAKLSVRDEGEGIAPEHAEHVFERFYRADPSRTRGSGGSGLGLSIVASIAEAHGGRAYVSSKLGVGSTFTVELPLRNGADDALVASRWRA